jgi:exonuclease III
MLKVEGVTNCKSDVIFILDSRLGKHGNFVETLFIHSMNGEYRLIMNSTMDRRGVCIAVRKESGIEIEEVDKDMETENYLFIKARHEGRVINLGAVYGPNNNSADFYRKIYQKLKDTTGEFIMGGDFNTILDNRDNNYNLDRIGRGNIPNIINSRILNEWIEEGLCMDPFRVLYPEDKEYSHIQFGEDRNTVKNRLDFFLVTAGTMQTITDVRYMERMGKDFDHKEVRIEMGGKTSRGKKEFVMNSTLEKEYSKTMGIIGYYESLSTHLEDRNEELVNLIRDIDIKFREIEIMEIMRGNFALNENQIEELDRKRVEVRNLEEQLINKGSLLDQHYTCNFRTLYEVTMMNIKGKLLAKQTRDIKEKNRSKRDLIKRLEIIEKAEGKYSDRYNEILGDLEDIMDKELKERGGKFAEFFNANNERPTRAFYKIGKKGKSVDSVGKIRKDNGEDFKDEEERRKYFGNEFGKVYKKRIDNLLRIENFLLAEGAGVENIRKLSEEEKQTLEGELTLSEFKKALDSSNMNSACGWDGISYRMIRTFWPLIGPLLTLSANESMREGELSNTFRNGIIKLIPKKKESARIGDWRPITLLSCGYKLISGVIANRIEKYLGTILGRAQKGFLRNKNIHLCTMNIIDNIAYSWGNKEEMAVLCVDFSKAFDTVEHCFIIKVFEFFNFGPQMCNMVKVILKNRESCIIMDEGYSESFKIERGTPQGDRSSPYVFILCIEILLARLEMEGCKIEYRMEFNEELRRREGLGNMIGEAYADDLTIIIKWSVENVKNMIRILEDFGEVSGLQINVGKTQLMLTGKDYEEEERTRIEEELGGIRIVEKINILGVIIDRKLEEVSMEENWRIVENKMINISRYWTQFGLSIAGRIMIAKTYLVSQAVYLMGVLEMSNDIGTRLNNIVINYVKGRGRAIAQARWYCETEKGGYGIIDLMRMNRYIKASWIIKWKKEARNKDYVKERVMAGKYENIECIDSNFQEVRYSRVGKEIGKKWEEYKREFYGIEKNIVRAVLFGNTGLLERNVSVENECFERHRREYVRNRNNRTTVGDMLEEGNLKDKRGIEMALQVQLNFVEYFRFRNAMAVIMRKIKGRGIARSLGKVGEGKSKGAGYLRKLLHDCNDRSIETHPYINTLTREINEEIPIEIKEIWMGGWNMGRLEPKIKNVIFKFVQGQLLLNEVLARIFPDTNNNCTFCTITGNVELETVKHLLWDCNEIRNVKLWMLNALGEQGAQWHEILFGVRKNSREVTRARIIYGHIYKWYIFTCRWNKKLPTVGEIRKIFNRVRTSWEGTRMGRAVNSFWVH